MSSTKCNQIGKRYISIYKHYYAKYSHAYQVLNISFSNPLYDIDGILSYDNITIIVTGSDSTIKGEIIKTVTSLASETNDILLITNLLNKCPMYTTDKEGDNQNLRSDENFKSILKDAIKDNRDRVCIYLNINHKIFKPSFTPEIFEDISKYPLPTPGPTSGSDNSKPIIGPGIQLP